MLILKTIQHDTVWGGHLYSLYCRDGVSNEIINGKWKGKCLNEVFPVFKADFHLSRYAFFPLTLALTEARQNLSIQVHPDKRESWYFIQAPHSGAIINGCTCHEEAEQQQMIRDGRFFQMADTLPVRVGDYVFVEPGTLHAITAGSLVFEIEEGPDLTYRFYDYDRLDINGNKRELHLEKAISALDIHRKSLVRTYDGGEIQEPTYVTRLITDCSSYCNESATIECFTLVKGSLFYHDLQVVEGSTVLMWPGDVLETLEVELAFVSKIREDIL